MKPLRIPVIVLLAFNGISAIFGGGALMIDTTGQSIGMPLSLLRYSPFEDFLIPGILLFLFNGLSSVLVAIAVGKKAKGYPLLVMGQGVASVTWIVTQVIMIRGIGMLHYLYGSIGLVVLLAGIYFHIYRAAKRLGARGA